MGIEYRIRFPVNPAELDHDLRSLRSFADFGPQRKFYNFRFDPAAQSGMPNAWVRIESDGLYFCDSGGPVADRAVLFRSIIDMALKRSEKVVIESI